MATRGIAHTVSYVAWDTYLNVPAVNDHTNHTIYWSMDGAAGADLGSEAQIDSINMPGVYTVSVSIEQADCDLGTLAGVSTTAGVVIIPTQVAFERLPDSEPGTTSGVPLVSSLPTANAIAGQVWDEIVKDENHDTNDTAGKHLQDIIEDTSDGGPGPWTSGSSAIGPGAIEKTITITKDAVPVDGAEVWITTDAAGLVVVAGTLYTDILGEATFMLDANPTYYAWAQKGGVNFAINPTTFAVE